MSESTVEPTLSEAQQEYFNLIQEFEKKYGASPIGIDSGSLIFDSDYEKASAQLTAFMESNPVPSDSFTSSGDESSTTFGDGTSTFTDNAVLASSSQGVQWNGTFNGNTIFYDEAATEEAKSVIEKFHAEFLNHLVDVAEADKFFDEVNMYPYNKLVPSPRFNRIAYDIYTELDAAYNDCIAKIDDVTGAIRDYSDGGEIDSDSTAILNQWLASGTGNPGNDGGSDGGDFDAFEPTLSIDNVDSTEEIGDSGVIDNDIGSNDIEVVTDEELVIPNVAGSVLGGALTGTGAGLISPQDDSDSLEISDSLSEIGASLFGDGSSRFLIPSLDSSIISTDGVKGASAVGFAGAAVAAVSAAVGGKIYHDKKQDDENDETIEEQNDEKESEEEVSNENQNVDDLTETENGNDEIRFGVSGVEFKESLFNDIEVDE